MIFRALRIAGAARRQAKPDAGMIKNCWVVRHAPGALSRAASAQLFVA